MGAGAGFMAASMATQAGGAYAQSQALKTQADYQKTMANINARNAELEAEDVMKQGEQASREAMKNSKRLQGAQRAAAAASGISVDTGSAADLRAEADLFGKMDAEAIKNNAWREAFGLKAQASQARGAANFQSKSAKEEARRTLITGGMNAGIAGLQAKYYADNAKPRAKKNWSDPT